VAAKHSSNSTWRIWAVIGVIALGGLLAVLRLAQLQILHHDRYAEQARLSHISEITVSDRRGALLDRNGYPLAASEDSYNVMVERRAWENSAEAAASAQNW
jgi:cell division protein FtsI/penicillin-binding protein 2